MSRLREDLQFLNHIQDANPNAMYKVSLEWQKTLFGYPKIDETVFVGYDNAPLHKDCANEEEEKSTLTPQKAHKANIFLRIFNTLKTLLGIRKPRQGHLLPIKRNLLMKLKKKELLDEENHKERDKSFLRIFNVNSPLLPSSEATLTITPEEYKAAQRLGLTKGLDQAITSRVIGTLGDFRYDSRRDAVLYDVLDDLHLEEEVICQTIFERVEALQGIEWAYTQTPHSLPYAEKGPNDPADMTWNALLLYNHYLEIEIEKQKNNTHEKLLLESYQRDLAQIKRLLEGPEAYDKYQTPTKNASKNDIEAFLHSRLNEALRHGRETDELISIGSRINPFRGRLTNALANTDKLIRDHRFDQTRSITKAHQGDYSDASAKRVTLTSFHTPSGSQRDTLERFTFTAALIFSPEDPLSYKNTKNQPTWSISGWAKVFKRIRNVFGRKCINESAAQVEVQYNRYKSEAKGADTGILKAFMTSLRDLGNLFYDGGKALVVSFASAGSSFFEAGYKAYLDINDFSEEEIKLEPPIEEATKEILDTAKRNSKGTYEQTKNIFRHIMARVKKERGIYREETISTPNQPGSMSPDKKTRIKEIQDKFCEKYKHTLPLAKDQIQTINIAPLALPPSFLTSGLEDNDILGISMGGLESFYDFFDLFHDKNPATSIYAMALYWLTTACMVAPAAVTAVADKAHLPIDTFIKINNAMAAAMVKGEFAGVVSTNFSWWQIATTVGEGLTGGEDSLLGAGAELTQKHWMEVIVAACSVYGIGVLMTEIFEPLAKELGNSPMYAQTITGGKTVFVGAEAFASAPHERSIVGRLLFDLIDFAVCVIRLPLSFGNLFYMALPRKLYHLAKGQNPKPINWPNVIEPWAELLHKGLSAFLRLFDFLLRLLNLVGSIIRMFLKALVDWFFGLLIFLCKALPILLMFAFPPCWYLVYLIHKEIGQTLQGLKDNTPAFLSSPGAVFRRMLIEKAGTPVPKNESAVGPEVPTCETLEPTPTPAENVNFWKKWALKTWRCELTPFPGLLIRAKFMLFFTSNWIKEKIQYVYNALRNFNIRYLNSREAHVNRRIKHRAEEYMGRSPAGFPHSAAFKKPATYSVKVPKKGCPRRLARRSAVPGGCLTV